MTNIANMKYCKDCGTQIAASAHTCPHCGGVQGIQFTANGKNRIVALILAWFLGAFGIHKFYLGNTMQGVLYLLFFWTCIPAIIAFFEGIGYLMQSDEQFAARYP